MKTIAMNEFGRTLTDRHYGKQVAEKILQENTFPLALNFQGVFSLGSSFGDEIFNAIGPKQGFQVEVSGANEAVKSCLRKVAEDAKVKIIYR